jgi:hypothetical protein
VFGPLLKVLPPEELIKYAVWLNQHSGVLVERSYLDILNAIRMASHAVLASAPANAQAPETRTLNMRKQYVSMSSSGRALLESTVTKALVALLKLEADGVLTMMDDISQEHGHAWFARVNCKAVLQSNCDKFTVRILESSIQEVARSGTPGLVVNLGRRNLFTQLILNATSLFNRMDAACKSAHGDSNAQYCMVDPAFLTSVQSSVAIQLMDKARALTSEHIQTILRDTGNDF